jgi:phospholipid/cholesterol/gamma-HCH transport system substrate-binding protein
MPRTRSLAWSQLKIGIIAASALVLATILIVAVGGQGGFAWERYALKTKFADIKGMKSGAVVRVAGVEVGKVTEIEFVGADVQVTVEVNDSMQQRITDQSRAMIGYLSLLGEPVIDITPASQGRPLQDGDFIQSANAPGQISDVAAAASESLDQATLMLQDIRAGKGTVGKLFTDDQLYREVSAFVTSAQTVAGYVARGQGTIGMLAKDPTAARQLQAALTNLNETTRRINAGEGSLGKLLKDEALANSLTSAGGSADRILKGLDKGEGTAGKLLKDQQLYDRVNAISDKIDSLMKDLNAGQGTAGQLLHDKQLYDNMNAAASELRGLIAEIKKDPKKYLNVRVSIF